MLLDNKKEQHNLLIWLAIALILHLGFMVFPYAFWIDMGTFRAWAIGLVEHGLPNFYSSMWSDYPPGYMYVLWLTGKFYALFDPYLQHTNQTLLITLVKLPPAIADIGSALMIWLILKPLVPAAIARNAALIYAFNPVTIFISAVWGQVDSVMVFLMLVVMWLLQQDKFAIAGIIGAVSVIVKPQGLFLAPIFLLSQWYRRAWWQWLVTIIGGILMIWLMVLPFVWSQVNFGSVNAAAPSSLLSAVIYPLQFLYKQFMSGASTYPYASVNAFNIWAGVNWKPDSTDIFGLTYRLIGLGLLGVVITWIGIFLRKHPDGIFLAAAVMMMAVFMLPTRMHERYIFYAIAFLAISAALRPSLRSIYFGVTLTSAINIGYVFVRYNHQKFFDTIPVSWQQALILLTAIINLGLFLALISHTFNYVTNKITDQGERVQRLKGDYMQLSIPELTVAGKLLSTADYSEQYFANQSKSKDLTHWQLVGGSFVIFAIALGFRLWHLDTLPVPVFDEVFFPKFATQYIDGKPEWEGHPPLGKYIIALGITIFGRNAFGDRIMEALFGSLLPVLLIGLVYLLTSRRSLAIIAGTFLLLDGLFLVESRFSLMNVFLVAFGLSSQIFLLAGLKHKGNQRTLLLCLSGIMLGASPAVKWNGLGFLLMVVLIVALVWIVALLFPKNLRQLGILAQIRSLHWWQYPLCFVLMPALLYIGQWVPHLMMNSGGVPFFWESFVAVHKHILWWHGSIKVVKEGIDSTPVHPYCSTWFSWAVLGRPISYYFHSENNTISAVTALGNPILWWLSTASVVGLSAWGLRRLQGITAYLLIGYAANYLPWAIAKRCIFVYHYMSALVFSFIGLAVVTDILLRQNRPIWRCLGIGIIAAVVIAYCYFLPIWLGMPLSTTAFYQRMWFMPGKVAGFNWI